MLNMFLTTGSKWFMNGAQWVCDVFKFNQGIFDMININGVSYSGKNVTIHNGEVFVDGKLASGVDSKVINIKIDGNIDSFKSDHCNAIEVVGDISQLDTISGDVCVYGSVRNGITTKSGDIVVSASVTGDVSSMSGDISCTKITGNVKTVSGDIRKK